VLALVLEDPPSRASNDPAAIARDVVEDAVAARSDPAAARARLLADNPLWGGADADHAVANRASVDVDRAAEPLLRADWDLGAMAAAVTAPITLLAATPGGSALGGPDRDELIAASARSVVVESGHGVHRDRPAVWVAVVAEAATRAFGSATDRPGA
jgi:hypothetical protein